MSNVLGGLRKLGMNIERFEDIRAWQESRELTKMVFGITFADGSFKNYRLREQIEGAAISTMEILRKALIPSLMPNL